VPPLHDPPVPHSPGAPVAGAVTVAPLSGMPEVRVGDDLVALLIDAVAGAGLSLEHGDCLVVSSKVVSKALGLVSDRPRAAVVDAATRRVVAERRGPGGVTRVVESAAGPVMEAERLRSGLLAAGPGGSAALGVVLSDTAGRPWRAGQTDFALGAAGLAPLEDLRGGVDADGRPLVVTARALADEVAAAADLVKGKADGVPAALVRGLPRRWFAADADGARTLVRTGPGDWFALGHAEAVRAALGVAPGTTVAEETGIASTGPEPLGDLVARVVALALVEVPDGSADVEVHSSVGGPGTSDGGDTGGGGRSHGGGSGSGTGGPGSPGWAEVVLDAPDPYELGRLVERVRVAATSESLRAEETGRAPASTTIRLHPA
jgi:coenzyme F420-0:L-glutamate ligase/coenzyme F420-1:gamma-L-glutamate ligase